MWNDPRIVWPIAVFALLLLAATVVLLRRDRKRRPRAAVVCVLLSVGLHAALLWFMPKITFPGQDRGSKAGRPAAPATEISLSHFSDEPLAEISDEGDAVTVVPLPVPTPFALPTAIVSKPTSSPGPVGPLNEEIARLAVPPATTASPPPDSSLEELLSDLLIPDLTTAKAVVANQPAAVPSAASAADVAASTSIFRPASVDRAAPATVVGSEESNSKYANRFGDAKQIALRQYGGDETTEAAVQAALRWLATYQRSDGSWDPVASGAGQERMPLGESRPGAGTRCQTGITGLAILSMLGNGSTHRQGPHAANVHAALSYLIRNQAPDGSLAGPATRYEQTYCHGMAALALCETAAITQDPQAIAAARAAVAYTQRLQHPTTGGWRYQRGEPGDTSQLGWQVLVLDAAQRAHMDIGPYSIPLANRFLSSVRAGRVGGLASYRPGQPPSRTMTAEALAARLLTGQVVPAREIAEAESYLLQEMPGDAKPNYYYWYYATLALHRLQDDAWQQWNQRLKQYLVGSQQPDGSWPTDSLWGGYGGRVYTTALNALSLEVYYRHAVRELDR